MLALLEKGMAHNRRNEDGVHIFCMYCLTSLTHSKASEGLPSTHTPRSTTGLFLPLQKHQLDVGKHPESLYAQVISPHQICMETVSSSSPGHVHSRSTGCNCF